MILYMQCTYVHTDLRIYISLVFCVFVSFLCSYFTIRTLCPLFLSFPCIVHMYICTYVHTYVCSFPSPSLPPPSPTSPPPPPPTPPHQTTPVLLTFITQFPSQVNTPTQSYRDTKMYALYHISSLNKALSNVSVPSSSSSSHSSPLRLQHSKQSWSC